MTKQTKEAVKTTIVIIIVILVIIGVWIYPLNQSGKIIVRPEEGDTPGLNLDSIGLTADTVSAVTEDNIRLFGYYFTPNSGIGTAVLIHGLMSGLESQIFKAKALLSKGWNVVIYDQRAFGKSESEYRSGGYFEAYDLQAVISRLDLEERLTHPVLVWGEEHGATAAIRTWLNEDRIDFVIAENPVINGRDWQKRVIKYRDMSAPNIYLSLIWWWMKQKSGFEIPIEDTDISEKLSSLIENRSDRLLLICCGENDQPENEYISELADRIGDWQVITCGEEKLFDNNQEKIIDLIDKLVVTDTILEPEIE